MHVGGLSSQIKGVRV